MPTLECPHFSRLSILRGVMKGISESHRTWEVSRNMSWRDVPDEILVQTVNGSLQTLANRVEADIANDRDKCSRCINASREVRPTQSIDDASSGSEDEDSHRVLPAHLKKVPEMKGARRRGFLQPRAPKYLPQAKELKPQKFELLPRNKFDDFDDYYRGPVLEDLHDLQRPGGLEGQPFGHYALPTIRSSWERFKDYGYRLEPEFALMFNSEMPLFVREHLLPAPVDHPAEEEPVKKNQVVVMGMREMLNQAGDKGSLAAMQLFVAGKTPDGRLVRLDLSRDEVYMTRKNFMMAVDIDSIIWTTHLLHLHSDLGIHVLPYHGKFPPMYKNNHTYIELLMPQSEQDQAEGGRTEWFSTRHALSTIPHTHFGKLPVAGVTFNVSVFFPRMRHRDPLTGKKATLIPWEVQEQWLTNIVYPAIMKHENPSTLAYKDYTVDEWRWKSSFGKRLEAGAKTVPVLAKNLKAMQFDMMDSINEDAELSRFGSFFFVLDGRGMKESTMVEVGSGRDPYRVLCEKFPQLDWKYMMQRKNGQLLIDLGMGFHPVSLEEEPLVALWKLDKLHASYAAAGMNKGTTHHTNTFQKYGGMQAEMGAVRQRTVQLCFRSSYGLYYQPVRRGHGGDISLCTDVDAYDVNDAFRTSIQGYIKMLLGSEKKTYGTREEMRGSGRAIMGALQDVEELVGCPFPSPTFQYCCLLHLFLTLFHTPFR